MRPIDAQHHLMFTYSLFTVDPELPFLQDQLVVKTTLLVLYVACRPYHIISYFFSVDQTPPNFVEVHPTSSPWFIDSITLLMSNDSFNIRQWLRFRHWLMLGYTATWQFQATSCVTNVQSPKIADWNHFSPSLHTLQWTRLVIL